MLTEERRRRLLETVNTHGALTVGEAEKAFRVSRMTVHRDLEALAGQGLLRKVHGGVVAIPGTQADPRARPFEERLGVSADAKRAIGAHLAKVVADAHTLVLDASSTVYCLAESLPTRRVTQDLFVVTGGLPLFSALLRRRDGVRVALHGGEPHARTGSLVGPLALASLGEARFDYAVISALGVLPEESAVYISNPEEVEVKRAYLARARCKVLAVDTGKLGQSGAYRLGPLAEFTLIVTEKGVFTPADLFRGRRRSGGTSRPQRPA